jgi:hypothetical protein
MLGLGDRPERMNQAGELGKCPPDRTGHGGGAQSEDNGKIGPQRTTQSEGPFLTTRQSTSFFSMNHGIHGGS